MREYEFRGRPRGGEWVYGDLIHGISGTTMICDVGNNFQMVAVDPDSVSMYTGKKSRSGKKIYGGDRVTYSRPYRGKIVTYEGIASWDSMMNCWRVTPNKTIWKDNALVSFIDDVVGNIYDEKERPES